MSVVSSRISSMSSILKSIGSKSPVLKQATKVYYKFPKKENLKNILCSYEAGNKHKEYEELVRILRDASIKDNDLIEFLTEMRQCVSVLNSNHELFVEVLLKIKWTTRSQEVIFSYKQLLEDLICTQIHYTKTVIDHLVELFKPEDNIDAEHEIGDFKSEDIERLNHIHDILHKLLKVMPMSSELLLQSLVSRFPYIVHGTYTHEIYIFALLQILDYAPQMRSDILSSIINRLMVLDINIPREKKVSEDEEDDLMDDNFSYDETINDNNSAMANDEASKAKAVHPIARTLDACMELLFKYMHEFCFANGVLQIESLKTLYFDILKAFETIILPTHATQCVQYVVFYLCSFKTAIVEAFVDNLWHKVINPNVALVTRQSAVYYISSLLSTASFVTPGLLTLIISRLAKWIHKYITMQESVDYTNDDMQTHVMFYYVCQAFFHLFIARHEQFVDSRSNILFLQELDIPRIISCRLNPLKVCDDEIVHSFANITRTYQLAYCYAIIEINARTEMPVFEEKSDQPVLLSSFFPFESYTLQRSGQRIATLFRTNIVDAPGNYLAKRCE